LHDDVKVDWRNFWIKQMCTLFTYFENFVSLLIFAQISRPILDNENNTILYYGEILVRIFIDGLLYSLTKYNLLYAYYITINKVIFKIFSNLALVAVNLWLSLAYLYHIIVGMFTVRRFCGDI